MTDLSPPLLVVERLSVRRQREVLLDEVSIDVSRGSIHAVVGRNGSGKSTLLSAILGRLPFDGRIVVNWLGDGRIAYVPQAFTVDATLPVTVQDFLALTRQRRPVCLGLASSTRKRVGTLLDHAGLAGLERRPLAALSGGELRRVLVANALDPLPELLLLDEPTAGLDDTSSRWLSDTLARIRREGRTTVVMVSHDLDEVRRVADGVTVLDRRVLAHGSPRDVFADGAAATATCPPGNRL